jgi:hypothetical protein
MMTEKIKAALRLRHSDFRQWIYFDECPVGTGWKGSNFIDGYAIGAWPSAHNKRIAYEVKISRQDFQNELKKPLKRRPAIYFSNEYYFVAPKGMIRAEEVPPDCGLIEFTEESAHKNDRLITKVPAPFRESIRPTWNFTAALLRRLHERAEVALREIERNKPKDDL